MFCSHPKLRDNKGVIDNNVLVSRSGAFFSFSDKQHELRRQNEKLEEKIMDLYKFYDPLTLEKKAVTAFAR